MNGRANWNTHRVPRTSVYPTAEQPGYLVYTYTGPGSCCRRRTRERRTCRRGTSTTPSPSDDIPIICRRIRFLPMACRSTSPAASQRVSKAPQTPAPAACRMQLGQAVFFAQQTTGSAERARQRRCALPVPLCHLGVAQPAYTGRYTAWRWAVVLEAQGIGVYTRVRLF